MNRLHENTARWILSFILITLPLGIFGYQYFILPNLSETRTIKIMAAAPEQGGFDPEIIRIAAGETVHLVIHSPDVLHGFSIGPGLGLNLGKLAPGQTLDYDLQIDQPGRYTLYCTVWCSPNHWRMRLTIEVYDPSAPGQLVVSNNEDPTIIKIGEQGIDIDAPHPATSLPANTPSSKRGALLFAESEPQLSEELLSTDFLRWQHPDGIAETLIDSGFSERDAWDIVAYLWRGNLTTEEIERATSLFAQNCAACHGENGNGDGPGAVYIEAQNFHGDATPTAFSNYETMLGGNSAIYYAKLRRGGMGTSMPGFGNIFSPEEAWLLVDFIWSFVFEE